MNNVIPLRRPFRPHLVTPSEAFERWKIEKQEERNRRINSGVPVVVAICFDEGMK